MKRSEINNAIKTAIELLDKYCFKLPEFAYWSMDEWRKNADKIDTLREVMMGWDVTDFGTGDFDKIGAVLFTIRNGKLGKEGVGSPYAEKILVFKEGQRLPIHHHVMKTEDIINRGGGTMEMKFYLKNADGTVDYQSDVEYFNDGIMHTAKAGEPVSITTGNSVRLDPFVNHTFGAKMGDGALICGEVSKVNDDNTDNYFAEPTARFAEIEEDEEILYPLCNEYDKLFPIE
ncbi:MAG: D-lyxose/D-mannose family sugar isomerase [Clostridia bacterium]|nr:D-lyxose/D-mannose family sugar isomerase [Clostridia bacterium]